MTNFIRCMPWESSMRTATAGRRSFITVGAGVTLTLRNITLKGLDKTGGQSGDGADNSSAVIKVNGGTLILENGAKIAHNRSTGEGGGVHVDGGTFTMSGGTVSGNTTAGKGGGVYVKDNGSLFNKTGGTIYGNSGDGDANTAKDSNSGHAVWVESGSRKRNSTAGETVNLSSSGSANWE